MGQTLASRGGAGRDEVDYKYEQLKVQYVSLNQLFSMAKIPSMVRTGATENLDVRRKAYVYQDGYSGVMYLAETTNMQHTEDQLLQQQEFRDNIQQTSNKAAAPGYVYLDLIKEE